MLPWRRRTIHIHVHVLVQAVDLLPESTIFSASEVQYLSTHLVCTIKSFVMSRFV